MSHVEMAPVQIAKEPQKLKNGLIPGDNLTVELKGNVFPGHKTINWDLTVLENEDSCLTLKANLNQCYPFEYVVMAFLKKGRFVTADNQPIPFLEPSLVRRISLRKIGPHDFFYPDWLEKKEEARRQVARGSFDKNALADKSLGRRGAYSLIHYLLAREEAMATPGIINMALGLMEDGSVAETKLLTISAAAKPWPEIRERLIRQSERKDYNFAVFDGTGVFRYQLYDFIHQLLIGGTIQSTPRLHALLVSYFPSLERL